MTKLKTPEALANEIRHVDATGCIPGGPKIRHRAECALVRADREEIAAKARGLVSHIWLRKEHGPGGEPRGGEALLLRDLLVLLDGGEVG